LSERIASRSATSSFFETPRRINCNPTQARGQDGRKDRVIWGKKDLGSDNRTGDEFWKVCNEHGVLPPASTCWNLSPVDIDGITHGLEGVKRYADGQEDCDFAEVLTENISAGVKEEIGVLEITEKPKVGNEAGAQPELAKARIRCIFNENGTEVVDDAGGREQEKIPLVPIAVEKDARE